MSAFLRGTGVALATPFNNDGSIDFDGVTSLVEYCINGGVEYLVVLGTTAESVTLTKEEKKSLVAHIIQINNKRLPLVIGIGGNNTAAILEEMRTTNVSDFDAILSVVPMYNRPTQEGIYQHYKKINDETPLPVLLYNVPSRTGVNMSADTTLRLSQLDNIIGIKEATGDFTQVLKILKNRPKDFLVISGDDALALPAVAAGGDGVISVVGQGFPEEFAEMIRLGLSGETKKAFDILYKILPVLDYAFAEGNPAGIKNILKVKGICEDYLRLPLISVSEELAEKIKSFIKSN
ncbi:4-hydroxy-tetrahydrodipicolinate synthase [Aquimarina sp. 2201CG14-23]|uniref:4-hydroxy-tetrahydrodipicolinate synthase n=1 Tax=Aquimarina mycalae TaxID=3040073 RepID=UPI00247827D5|nr:4-hydroxy-tetrahydrodipicolinate synthase [Aquimarina sp. 2201CG14-23]MDH7448265.1 4-hydroxy-tetrahydrodipicolinate synthase [Aquimarina sp. 2201CG14-23]